MTRTYITESTAVLDMTGQVADALALLALAEEQARALQEPALLATVLAQRALVVLRSGDTTAALDAFDTAVGHAAAMEPRDRAIVMLNRGVLQLEQVRPQAAREDLSRAVAHAQEAGDATLESMARHNLGYVDFTVGRIPKAIAAYRQAASAWPGDPHPAMQLDLARALREAGLHREADQALVQVAAHARSARLFQDLAETELVRAECALATGDAQAALARARAALRRFARRGNLRWQRHAQLLVLTCERATLTRTADGAAPGLRRIAVAAQQLAEDCRTERRDDLARAAEVLAAECRLRAGAEVPVLAAPRRTDPLPLRLAVREVRALAFAGAGDGGRALREVRRGLDELGEFQRGLGSLDLRTAGAVHAVALAHVGLDVALGRGRAGDVLALVERSRATSTRLPRLRPPEDERTVELLAELRQVEDKVAALAGETAATAELSRLRSRASTLQRTLRARAWELEGDADDLPSRAPGAGVVRAAAEHDGVAFVSYARHRERWLAVVVHRGRSRVVPLADTAEVAAEVRRVRADLDAIASPNLPGPIAGAVRGSLRAGLERLDTSLQAPLGLAGESVVLSCSGPLTVLPWGLLPSRAAAPTVVVPSAGAWLRGRERRRPARPRAVALAGPALIASEQEARAVTRTWGGELVVGDAATTAATLRALTRADVLHVAAHGSHREDNPLFSSLRLADGPLYAYEIDPVHEAPHCVTLSACEAGLVTLRPGDEGLGLTHVLLHVGVVSVVAGVARVRDDVAAVTMQRVHALMAAGTSSAEALASALADAEQAPVPAPFVSFGGSW